MQLKRRRRLQRTLLASSCALLGTAPGAMADTGDWNVDTGVLYYSEADRVRAIEPAAIIKKDLGDDANLNIRVVTDTLSGATPTGAMPSSKTSTVTGPSGSKSTTTTPGANPLDPNFKDFRKAISATLSEPLAQYWRLDSGLSYSIEHDFKSQGVNLLLARDFNERNTTLSLGLAKEWDLVFPIGGIHKPLSTVPQTITTGGGGEPPEPPGDAFTALTRADETGGEEGGGGGTITTQNPPIAANAIKRVNDLLVGVTQVMSKDWLAELNFSYSRSEGYQNDPYKMVSILNTHLGGQLPTIGGPPVGEPLSNIYENRPDLHVKRAIYLGNKAYIQGDVLDFSYRYGWDDWGIKSNTFELRYRMPVGDSWYVMPHLRWYHQNAADFYRRGLLDTNTVPPYVSADYRLAEFSARTLGVEIGRRTSWGGSFSVRVEHYVQSGGSDPRVNIGIQQQYNLFPELKADIVQVSLSF